MGTHIWSLKTVFLIWALCSSPAFTAAPEASGCPNLGTSAPASPVLDSLKCRNDYTSHIRCSWTEAPDSSLSLFHLDPDESSVLPCVHGPPLAQNTLGQLRVQCRYNTSMFAIGFDDMFFFHTPHSPGLSQTVILTQHAKRPRSHDPTVNITDNGSWTLDPKPSMEPLTPDPLTLDQNLTHQASSGRPVRDWMDDRRGDQMEASGLGTESEASGWSFQQSRKTDTDSLPGPFNLQCVYDGEREVRCSWEMMRELAQFIRYNLSYRTQPDAPPEWCCAGLEEGSDDDDDDGDDGDDGDDDKYDEGVVQFYCLFSVSEAEQLLLDLKPEPRTRVIPAYKHIEPVPPVGLSAKLIGEDWVVNWTLPEYRTVPITSELRYWSTHSPEVMETLRLPPGVSVCFLAERSLLSSTHYLAQVRCNVSFRTGRGVRYAGYPSDWSKPVNWTTRPGQTPVLGVSHVYVLLATSVSVTVILMYFTLLAFHRKVKVWAVSLPSPCQSKALTAVCQAHSHHLPSYTEVDHPRMSEVSVLGDLKQLCALDWEYEDVTVPPAGHSTTPQGQTTQEEGGVTVSRHFKEENRSKDMWHVSVPSHTFPACSGVHQGLLGVEVLLCSSRFAHLTPNILTALQPCSEGYQQNPGSSGETVQDAALDICPEDVEMHDGYMDCPK